MTLRNFCAVLILNVFLIPGSYAMNSAKHSVKIVSKLCDAVYSPTLNVQAIGSGTLVRISDRYFIVTSAHAILTPEANFKICYEVQNHIFKFQKIQFVAAYAPKDLALLEVKDIGEFGENAIDWSDQLTTDDQWNAYVEKAQNQKVTANGYPFKVNGSERSRFNEGQIFGVNSKRVRFENVGTIEAKVFTEFGMSGGSLVDSNGLYLGMLSYHVLEVVPGAETRIRELGENMAMTGERMITIAIPTYEIQSWIKSLNSDARKEFQFTWSSPDLGLMNTRVVKLNGLYFSQMYCQLDSGKPGQGGVGGTNGSGIGGTNGSGIGGTNGSGIGGVNKIPVLPCGIYAIAKSDQAVSDYAKYKKFADSTKLSLTGLANGGIIKKIHVRGREIPITTITELLAYAAEDAEAIVEPWISETRGEKDLPYLEKNSFAQQSNQLSREWKARVFVDENLMKAFLESYQRLNTLGKELQSQSDEKRFLAMKQFWSELPLLIKWQIFDRVYQNKTNLKAYEEDILELAIDTALNYSGRFWECMNREVNSTECFKRAYPGEDGFVWHAASRNDIAHRVFFLMSKVRRDQAWGRLSKNYFRKLTILRGLSDTLLSEVEQADNDARLNQLYLEVFSSWVQRLSNQDPKLAWADTDPYFRVALGDGISGLQNAPQEYRDLVKKNRAAFNAYFDLCDKFDDMFLNLPSKPYAID